MKKRLLAVLIAFMVWASAWPANTGMPARGETGEVPIEMVAPQGSAVPEPVVKAGASAMPEDSAIPTPAGSIAPDASPESSGNPDSFALPGNTVDPSEAPTVEAGAEPTEAAPTAAVPATGEPTAMPTSEPDVGADTSTEPSEAPDATVLPGNSVDPSEAPTVEASAEPTEAAPTATVPGTWEPTAMPTSEPDAEPTAEAPDGTEAAPDAGASPDPNATAEVPATEAPSVEPSALPSVQPTEVPAEPTPEPSVAPEAFSIVLTAVQNYARANEIPVDVQIEICGGSAASVQVEVFFDDESMHAEIVEPSAEGTYSFSYMPVRYGSCTVCVTAASAEGMSAEASIVVPVAGNDVQNAEAWIAEMRRVDLTEDWRENIVNLAATQVGYEESKIDFILDENGVRQGYTFYGDWYGSSYGGWCGMFISYCLNRAGISDVAYPYEANCIKWRDELKSRGAYMNLAAIAEIGESYLPAAGDLVFFSFTEKNVPEHVGIVEEVGEDTLVVIEGNVEGKVVRREYELDDETIIAYANTRTLMRQAGVVLPTVSPDASAEPTLAATDEIVETASPTAAPDGTLEPGVEPTAEAVDGTAMPSVEPTLEGVEATAVPEDTAVPGDTLEPGVEPSAEAVDGTAMPSVEPTLEGAEATAEPADTTVPGDTLEPGVEPSAEAAEGTAMPSVEPTAEGVEATVEPADTTEPGDTQEPGVEPTAEAVDGTAMPSVEPTVEGTEATVEPADTTEPGDTLEPGVEPTAEGADGTAMPSVEPTLEGEEATVMPAETQMPAYACGIEAHEHAEGCYDSEGNLTCALEAHAHVEGCQQAERVFTEDELALIQNVIDIIDALPSSEEIESRLLELEADEEAYTAYFIEAAERGRGAYVCYSGLEPELQAQVSNQDKLMETAWLWSATILADNNGTRLTVYQSNDFTNEGANDTTTLTTLAYGQSLDEMTSQNHFKGWTCVFVENTNGVLHVSRIVPNDGKTERQYDTNTTDDGFILAYYGSLSAISVGDTVLVDYNYKATQKYNASGVGHVYFYSDIEAKAEPTNSVSTLTSTDTSEFIKINLYNYGGSINSKYNSNKNYPGFQYPGGTTSTSGPLSTSGMNFGDNIVENFTSSVNITGNEANGPINKIESSANRPVSGAMHSTLRNGYPALADGTSLKDLFDEGVKVNSANISGLFRYDEESGRYSYNSRTTHAQYSSNAFTLYNARITSNYLMYPFGNFLPFNSIRSEMTKVSDIDRDYFLTIAATAQKKYNAGSGEVYRKLSASLVNFVYLMDTSEGNTSWGGVDAVNKYFELAKLPKEFTLGELEDMRIYNIDYDEKTDFFFGMDMEMQLMQPKDGMTGPNGDQEMVFTFTGDDDVWVYIDNVLFLDLSGIHRHVGGKIDFVEGKVYYQELNPKTGDVDATYKTVEFSDLVSADMLNDKGTFKDYSTHTFKFYYMERGSGSSVCRMEFNFPLLREQTITVGKELSSDQADRLALLGNPDFSFQVLKANPDGSKTNELFIAANTPYTLYDKDGNPVEGSFATDENGRFSLKAGQKAEFSDIAEDRGSYYVRELLNPADFEQYGTIYVDGSSQTSQNSVTIGSDTFTGVDSSVKSASNGSTVFNFNNEVAFDKLGSLAIQKTLDALDSNSAAGASFRFRVMLDGVALPVGTAYTLDDGSTRQVEEAGVIKLAAGQTATVSNILSGTRYAVDEIGPAGYEQSWVGQSGVIVRDETAQAHCTNRELGTNVEIPLVKHLANPDDRAHSYTFKLVQLADAEGSALEGGLSEQITIDMPAGKSSASGSFTIGYSFAAPELASLPASFYYKLSEQQSGDGSTDYDDSTYIVEVAIDADGDAGVRFLTDEGVAEFTNTLVGTLEISKVLIAPADLADDEFSFTIEISHDMIDLKDSYPYKLGGKSGNLHFGSDGEAEVVLKGGETLVLSGLPIGTSWTVTEDEALGYLTSVQRNGGSVKQGNTSSGTIRDDDSEVVFTNTAHIELPTTGGRGSSAYTAGGLCMIAAALALLGKQKSGRRKASD